MKLQYRKKVLELNGILVDKRFGILYFCSIQSILR